MLYVGLDQSRKRLDYHALLDDGEIAASGAFPPDRDGLAHLVHALAAEGPVLAAIESMSGARFVHDKLELAGWDVRIADARWVKGLAPLACKTDRIDAWVLAELARRDLLPTAPARPRPAPGVGRQNPDHACNLDFRKGGRVGTPQGSTNPKVAARPPRSFTCSTFEP